MLREPRAALPPPPALLALLRDAGIEVTAAGRASISGIVTPDVFLELFGTPPPTQSGFADDINQPPLPIPMTLEHAVSSISIAPRHIPMK